MSTPTAVRSLWVRTQSAQSLEVPEKSSRRLSAVFFPASRNTSSMRSMVDSVHWTEFS